MKFVVLKIDDVENYCSFEQQEQLMEICNEIHAGRLSHGKNDENRYLVVNNDEPYAGQVKALIENHEGKKVTFD